MSPGQRTAGRRCEGGRQQNAAPWSCDRGASCGRAAGCGRAVGCDRGVAASGRAGCGCDCGRGAGCDRAAGCGHGAAQLDAERPRYLDPMRSDLCIVGM